MAQVQTNFRAADMIGGKAAKQGAARANKKAKAEAEPEVTQDEVPEGTGKEVLAWVGDDKDRAQRALDAEQASEQPRVSVVNPLKKIIEEDE